MTRSTKGKQIIQRLPPERVLVESDGPYVSRHGRPVEPRDVWTVIDHLADHWTGTRDDAAAQLSTTLLKITAGLAKPDHRTDN